MSVPFATRRAPLARLSGWSLAGAIFAAAVVVLLAGYWSTVESLLWVWGHDGTYHYAFLIFPLSAGMAFTLRHRLLAHAPVPSLWGLVAVALLVCIWYIGEALAINLPQHFALVAMFPALVLACGGWRALRSLRFPLAYLVVFAVPWGSALVGPLQDITARFAVGALHLTGVPVLLNGREIVTPAAVWMVEQACSGVKFFMACTALGSLYAWLMYTHLAKRIVFVVLAAIVPVIANILRVYFTIMIGETWGVQYASGTDHMIFGWQFFGTVLVLLLVAGWFFRDRVRMRTPAPTDARPPARRRLGIWLGVPALLIAGPVLATTLPRTFSAQQLELVPPQLAGWHTQQITRADWRPVFHGAAGQLRAAYQATTDGVRVGLFHAVYTGRPRHGHSLITYGNDVYDAGRARVLDAATRHVVLADGTRVAARELRLTGVSGDRLVWYWYCVDGRCTASPVLTKLLEAWQVVRGGDPRASVWALSLPVRHGTLAHARATLRAFAAALPGADALVAPAGHAAALAGSRS